MREAGMQDEAQAEMLIKSQLEALATDLFPARGGISVPSGARRDAMRG